jgi:long-chain acyl-CoA synthetase
VLDYLVFKGAINVPMNKPWLKHYEKGVPHHVEPPSLTLPDLLPAAAGRYPDRTALVLAVAAAGRLFSYSISYAKLYQAVTRFAASLQGLGVQKGDRVAIYLPNCPQFVIAFLAAVQIGAIVVPFNPLYSVRETEYQLKDCGANVVVVLDRFFPIVQQVQA